MLLSTLSSTTRMTSSIASRSTSLLLLLTAVECLLELLVVTLLTSNLFDFVLDQVYNLFWNSQILDSRASDINLWNFYETVSILKHNEEDDGILVEHPYF